MNASLVRHLAVLAAAISLEAQPLVHFHHVHLNSTNPDLAVAWYLRHFPDLEKAQFGGAEALWAEKSWILFNKVDRSPAWEVTTALYHIGWGTLNPKGDYDRYMALGSRFDTHYRDLSEGLPVPAGRSFYMYLLGPDNVLIEDITATYNRYNHVHLLSEDPVSAGEWYQKEFGFPPRTTPPSREPRFYNGTQIGPASGFSIDNVSLPIFNTEFIKALYPREWQGRTHLESPKGRAIDHFAFSCDNLDALIARLRKDGVKILEEPRLMFNGTLKSAFIEGPDQILIELVEGEAKKQ